MGIITSICNNNTSNVSTLESNPISKTNKIGNLGSLLNIF